MEEKNYEMIKNVLNKVKDEIPKKGVYCKNIFGEETRFEPFKNKGRPFILENEQQTINAIVNYFKWCEENEKPYTTAGLASALGFTNRMTLLNYQKSEKYGDIINTAKLRIEQYAEEQLYSKNAAGAKFSLSCNFKGWAETTRVQNDFNISKVEDYLDEAGEMKL